MKYLPFERLVYETPHSEDQIIAYLKDEIRSQSYSGSIKENSFELKRVIYYRNSFLPIIFGSIEKGTLGTRVSVRVRPHLFVLIFGGIWCGIVGLVAIIFLVVSLASLRFQPGMFIPLLMFAFGYALIMGAFKYESRRSKKDLAQLFNAEPNIGEIHKKLT